MPPEKEVPVYVKDIMTKNVVYIDSSKTAKDAAVMMNERKVGSLVVMENDIVVGIVTERDLVRRVIAKGKPDSVRVKDVMSSPLVVINPDESVTELAQLMHDRKIHRVPVIKPPERISSKLVGIVTSTDLIRCRGMGSDSKMTEVIEQLFLRKRT